MFETRVIPLKLSTQLFPKFGYAEGDWISMIYELLLDRPLTIQSFICFMPILQTVFRIWIVQ